MRALSLMMLVIVLLTACNQSAPAAAPAAEAGAFTPPTGINVSATELETWLQQPERPFLLDVREPFESDIASIPGTSTLIPLGQLQTRVGELDPSQEIVVYCRSGNRSQQAIQVLQAAGFTNVKNLSGGILSWSDHVDPSVPQY
ncbi:MAG: rhodanese-like domain-containing protein [Chloroflexaceae bacterium]|nr:rhodanese-like domain-containing protein [Chloroflexaceae bacterium]